MTKPKSQTLRKKLVDELKKAGNITSDEVAEAFLTVPRELFVPEALREAALTPSTSTKSM